MKKHLLILAVLLVSATAFAQKTSPLVGMWQQAQVTNQVVLALGPQGKVFLPDGRMFGYFLNPTEFDKYERREFGPWLFATYEITSDSTYIEQVSLHQNREWEGTIYFQYTLLNSRTLATRYEHTYPDGSVRPFVELWVKVVDDPKEQDTIMKQVAERWDEYVEKAKILFER